MGTKSDANTVALRKNFQLCDNRRKFIDWKFEPISWLI